MSAKNDRNFWELYMIFRQILSIKNFFKVWISFSQGKLSYQLSVFTSNSQLPTSNFQLPTNH
ncbi:hypothetical protein SAMN05720469_11026 [Fibrobacter intestinalis]|uniref:Uncharacterized protein n=1 Tax=Fibrobacter intestinalis TaxID=28122 RepID=A0A1M6TJB3_9BACT|nr:hypothetical protein SAMN05720469_11026 [Fibrobacter intestinalis]